MLPLKSAIYAFGSEWYEASDQDVVGDPQYFGYLNNTGKWIIQQINNSAGTIRYVNGKTSYAAAWSARASLSYAYYHLLSNTTP
jgi:hypothetical protein